MFKHEEKATDALLMQYGAPGGDPRFLKALTKFLTDEYQEPVDEWGFFL